MAKQWFGHFDSTADDPRALLAEDWANYIKSFITNGIRNGGDNLKVKAEEKMTVTINRGSANIEGYIYQIQEDLLGEKLDLSFEKSHYEYNRVDRLVLRLDRTAAVRKIYPFIIIGAASKMPMPNDIERNQVIYDICLAEVRIRASSESILDSDIKDTRYDNELCGLINSVLGVDSDDWQAQFDDFIVDLSSNEDEFLLARKNLFDASLGGHKTSFNQQFQGQKRLFETWFSNAQLDLQKTAQFDFDNLAAMQYVIKETYFSDSLIEEEIYDANTGTAVAYRETRFSSSNIGIKETVYAEDGRTVFRQHSKMITFSDDGVIEEEVK